jgi:hypothetical protein
MDGPTMQAKIYAGYAAAAQRMGLQFGQYRATSAASAAIAPGNLLQTLPASFNVQDMAYKKPSGYGKAAWYCVADGRQLQPGDYLSGNGYTYFIGAMEPLLPIVAILCNTVVTIYRPQQTSGVGLGGYGGNTQQNQTAVVTQFPASILSQSKAEKGPTNLPGDVRVGWDTMLLPIMPGVVIKPHDIVNDAGNNQYVISCAELAEHGWRCEVVEAET